jgi:hypothetical protein
MPEDANEYFKKAFGNTISKGARALARAHILATSAARSEPCLALRRDG